SSMMTVSPSDSRKVPMAGKPPRGRSGGHEQYAYTPGRTVGRKFRSRVLRSDSPGMTSPSSVRCLGTSWAFWYDGRMTRKRREPSAPRYYFGTDVTMSVIRRYARQIAERFKPDKIVLFGSHAYGTPHADSDVDLLVVMPARNVLDQAFRIRVAVEAPFPMDLIVRKPDELARSLADGESFATELMTRGKLLYEAANPAVGAQ